MKKGTNFGSLRLFGLEILRCFSFSPLGVLLVMKTLEDAELYIVKRAILYA